MDDMRAADIGPCRMKTLSLVKGEQHFCFYYQAGEEAEVFDELVGMVRRPDLSFDWFDATVLAIQLGQNFAGELKAMVPKKT